MTPSKPGALFRQWWVGTLLLVVLVATSRWTCAADPALAPSAADWRPLFDGQSLDGWKVTSFGGEGDVTVEAGKLILDFGQTLTGVTSTRQDLPRNDYELLVEAQRLGGSDFFCGLTFPVGDAYLTLVVGGWGGALVGLSSLDGQDASENETQRVISFRKQTWYRIRTEVRTQRVQVWIDDQPVIDQSLEGHKLSLRPEVELSRPLGIAAWQTRAAIRKIDIRALK